MKDAVIDHGDERLIMIWPLDQSFAMDARIGDALGKMGEASASDAASL